MSEEQQTNYEGDAPPLPGDNPPPQDDPEPEPEPTPPPPTGETIAWEPQTWYSITYACRTPGCPNENVVRSAPMFYSNNGNPAYIRVVDAADGACGKNSVILTATKLDPQPVEE
ncbi:hypothetical protein [Streptomyces sp. NPDC018584]|uniref:hypothetical protein n=1 Tax=unclassified Streptomyces TaxID=2593676 RepID=UPI0037A39509